MHNRARLLISAGIVAATGLSGCGTAPGTAAGTAAGTAGPPAAQRLLGAAIAYDPGSRSVIAFGGQDRTGLQVGPSPLTWRWTGDRWRLAATSGPPARSSALMTPLTAGRGLLMFGGQTATFTLPSCPAPSAPGQPCTASVSPTRQLSDTWEFTAGTWTRLPAGPHTPGQGELLAADPAIGAVVLTGQSLAYTASALAGTWKWTGHAWSLLSATTPDQADSMGYDPVSGRLLAYGGMQPSTPPAGAGAPVTLGYSRTWALTRAGWVELHPGSTPGRAAGVLTPSPDLRRLLLITALGQTWTWTGQAWVRYPARDAPAGGSSWSGATLTAATDPSRRQIVVLVTNDAQADQTWTLSGGTWTLQPATP